MRFPVTQDAIDCGLPRDCSRCPVARGLYRMIRTPVSVGTTIRCAGIEYSIMPDLGDWIDRFDRGLPVAPITVELTAELDGRTARIVEEATP